GGGEQEGGGRGGQGPRQPQRHDEERYVDDAAADPEHAGQDPDGEADDDALPHIDPVMMRFAACIDDAPESRARRGPQLDPDEQERRDRQQEEPEREDEGARGERASGTPRRPPRVAWPRRISIPARDRRVAGADTPRSRTGR